MRLQLVFFMIPKSRQLATAVQLQPVQSSPVSSLFAVLWTGLLNSNDILEADALLLHLVHKVNQKKDKVRLV